MSGAWDPGWLSRRYAAVDDCPEPLLPGLVALPLGTLAERAAGLRRWRESLLEGRLPAEGEWPPESVAAPVRRALQELGVARYCAGEPTLVDALLADVLAAFGRQSETFSSTVAGRLRELEDLEQVRLKEQERARAARENRSSRAVWLYPAELAQLREQAERETAARPAEADGTLVKEWSPRVRAWVEIVEVFGDLGLVLGRGWNLAAGVLRHTGWLELVRLRALVKQLPELRAVVQALGRLHERHDASSVAETLLRPVRRLEEERREVPTPEMPAEARGVERSGEIARMLPVEAAMLGHPALRLLWHARRAERALLTYRVEGVETDSAWTERERHEALPSTRPRPERGPIVAVIDTSGSMHGLPEQVAKAVALEALRTAHAEGRRCLLFAHGGPGEVMEHELDLSADGIGRLLAFLGVSFGGGTDVQVMERVLDRLREDGWKNADVLFVSDGEWSPPAGLAAAVQRAREGGTRFHGVQVGNRGRTGLHALCDPVHVFRDWATMGGW